VLRLRLISHLLRCPHPRRDGVQFPFQQVSDPLG
jgi:hypothetical protein